MPDSEITRSQTEEELDEGLLHRHYAFGQSPNFNRLADAKTRRKYQTEVYEAAVRVDGKAASTALVIPMTQNVRGKVLSMGGIGGVATYPEYRRKGYVKQLLQHVFDYMGEQGYAVSTLYPFRESFYGRLGYITFRQARNAEFSPSHLKPLLKQDFNGTVERGELKEYVEEYKSFLNQLVREQHCFASFSSLFQDRLTEQDAWVAIAKSEGKIVGIMPYKISGFEGDFEIQQFYYLNSTGKYLLLQFLALHVDQVLKIKLPLLPADDIENWVFDLRVTISSRSWVPAAMGRVIDIKKLEGIEVGNGTVIFQLEDPQCAWNTGTWEFSSENGKLKVQKTNQETENRLSIQGLSAIVYGWKDFHDLKHREWLNGSEEFTSELQSLFPELLAFVNEMF